MLNRPIVPTTYCLSGFRIVSDLCLPGVTAYPEGFPTDGEIAIRCAPVPESLSEVAATFQHGRGIVQCNPNELLLKVPEVGRYLLRNGNEIIVDQAPLSHDDDFCAYLLGTMLGVLGHQRGVPPLHSSVIDVADGCVAFVGAKGAGKSTLAAALARRGHQVIADDVCFLQFDHSREIRAWPGIHRLRLSESSMAALGCSGVGVEREMHRSKVKYRIPLEPPRNPLSSRRLRRVYVLDASPACSAPSLSRIHAAATLEVLIQNVYRLRIAELMGHKPTAFVVCAATANSVPVFRFSRPLGFDVLPAAIDFLETHLRDIC